MFQLQWQRHATRTKEEVSCCFVFDFVGLVLVFHYNNDTSLYIEVFPEEKSCLYRWKIYFLTLS